MQIRNIEVKNPRGVHLRVAARIVEKSQDFKSSIVFYKGDSFADGNSILQLMILEAVRGSELKIVAVGEDEQKAIQEISQLFSDGGGI